MHESYTYPSTNTNTNTNANTTANDRNNRANNGYGDIQYNNGDKNVKSQGLDLVKLIESYKYD